MNSRRSFLQILGGATAGILLRPGLGALADAPSSDRLGQLLPRRKLGRTGEAVTMLGVGGWHVGRMSERDAQATIEAAIAGGVRFFDSCESYQDGGSERRLGKLLTPKYRDAIFLMTKTDARDAASARQRLDDSLRRMNTDHLDLFQIHSVDSPADVDERLQAGVLDALLEAKAAGKVRHIGFTGHRDMTAHLRMLDAKESSFDTCQMPVNLADPSYKSFVKNVMPRLVSGGVGILAMKTLANGGFFGGINQNNHIPPPHLVPDRVSLAEALHFVWSLPVSVVISGPDDPGQMKEKIAIARSFTSMDEEERQRLIAKVADLSGRRVEYYKI